MNLSPSQEPVAWGAVATALIGLAAILAAHYGIKIEADQQLALASALAIIIPLAVGYFVRKNVTPTAPPPPAPVVPPPTPPTGA